MTKEHKPITCSWCKHTMIARSIWRTDECRDNEIMCCAAWFQCSQCESQTPTGTGKTKDEAIEAAYAAVTQRPENLPLTLPQIKQLPTGSAIWMYSSAEDYLCTTEAATVGRNSFIDPAKLSFYRYKPTRADRAAAKAAQKGASNV